MSEFTQSTVSPFPNQNILFNSASGLTGQELQKNQLAIQGQQMDLTAADHEQVGRLAAGLLNEPDLGKRAQYYAQGVGLLQSQGLAKYAPPTMPDDGTLRMLATQAIPAAEQYKLNLTKAGVDAIWPTGPAPTTTSTTGTGTTGSVATAPSGTIEPAAFNNATAVRDGLIKRGVDPDTATALAANALHESVANPATGRGDNGNSAGLFQWSGPRLQAYTDTYGHSPDGSPLDEQLDNVVRELKGSEAPAAAKIAEAQGPAAKAAAVSQYYLRPKDTQAEMQRRSATALQLQQQIGVGPTTASVAPPTAQPGQPVPTQVAGSPMVSTAPAAPTAAAPTLPPAQTDTTQPPAPAQSGQPPTAQATPAPTSSRVTPPPAPTVTIPPRVPLPAAPAPTYQSGQYQGLTPDDVSAINRVAQAARAGTIPLTAVQTEIDSRRNKNISLAQTYQAAVEKQRTDDIATEQLKLQGANTTLQYWEKANPDAKITQVGGEIITQDPRDGHEIAPRIPVNANREDLAAALTVARLGPRIAAADAGTGPPVSPEDRAAYAVQANAYQQFKEVTDPISKQVKSVPTRPLPPQFPGAAGPMPLTQGLSPSQQEIERDPAAFEVNKRNYNDDATDIRALSTSGRQLQSDQVRIKQMQDVLQGFTSGPGTDARTAASAWFQRWLPSALTGWEKEPPTLSGAAAAQEFQKLALTGAGQQDQALLGKNAGFRSMEMFRNTNPNSELLDPTNAHILDMQLIQNQANQDYIQAAQAHFKQNEQAFKTTHQYNSLNDFDADWGAKRNPEVYAAAIGAIGGQPASKWANGLSDDEYARALQIVQRAKPSAVVQTKSGPYSMQPNAVTTGSTAPPGTRVLRFDHNGNQIQ